ncbi:App1 family protein [Novosphingobium sp. 9U]|uniref:App1 family protein n=1 Tax=Novosphingobium sp. 9U TaxID=2653158 RepID=UPI00135883FF|nr:phosphatase domain-containing protein [Novosphingobium sp. 9U]
MNTADAFGRWLRAFAAGLEQDVDQLKDLLTDPVAPANVQILPYAGYRNDRELRVSGRVVEYRPPLAPADDVLDKLLAMWAIYNSREVGGITVRCEAHGIDATCISDEEGYFQFTLSVDRPLPGRTTWENVKLSAPGHDAQGELTVPILAPGSDDRWAIISDIDDTIMETGATNFAANWRRIVLEQPGDRLAVPGSADLYRTIARDHASPTRPFFYVSSSPWNLYGFLTQFMELNRIPHGPMFLKDLGIDAGKFIDAGHKTHKLEAIRSILRFYPQHRFLLMGDNGQQDVEIYTEVVREFPQRIGAVFIRDVTGECAAGANATHLAEMASLGVQTHCAASFADGVSILRSLRIDNPVEATRASGEGAAA